MEIKGVEVQPKSSDISFFCFAQTTSDVDVGLPRRRDDDDGAGESGE
jgi:hypothetical protein